MLVFFIEQKLKGLTAMNYTANMTREDRRVIKTIERFFTQKHNHAFSSVGNNNAVKIRREGLNTFLVFDHISDEVYNVLNEKGNPYRVCRTYRGNYEVTLPAM